MHLASIVGDALGERFAGDSARLAHACRLVVRRAELRPLVGAYLPPPEPGAYGLIALAQHVSEACADWFRAVASGHLVLGHRRYAAYLYGERGAEFEAEDEAQAAELFATAFFAAVDARRREANGA